MRHTRFAIHTHHQHSRETQSEYTALIYRRYNWRDENTCESAVGLWPSGGRTFKRYRQGTRGLLWIVSGKKPTCCFQREQQSTAVVVYVHMMWVFATKQQRDRKGLAHFSPLPSRAVTAVTSEWKPDVCTIVAPISLARLRIVAHLSLSVAHRLNSIDDGRVGPGDSL